MQKPELPWRLWLPVKPQVPGLKEPEKKPKEDMLPQWQYTSSRTRQPTSFAWERNTEIRHSVSLPGLLLTVMMLYIWHHRD